MKLALNSDLWKNIYYNLRGEFYRINDYGLDERKKYLTNHTIPMLEIFLSEQGVKIIKDIDGRWESVEIVLDEEELTVFLLTWT
jgi:hypothetical protein